MQTQTESKVLASMVLTGKEFRNFFAANVQKAGYLADEFYLFISRKGIMFNVIDSSHVAILLAFLDEHDMREWNYPTNDARVGINIHDLVKLAATVPLDEKVNVLVEFLSTGIRFNGFTLGEKTIAGYDAKEEGLLESLKETLKDKFSTSIEVTTGTMQNLVKNGLMISDLCKLVTNDDGKVEFSCFDNSGQFTMPITCTIMKQLSDCEGIYSLNFLENIVKKAPLASGGKAATEGIMTISLGNNIPCMIEQSIGSQSSITWLLAPRVEDQDETDEDMDAEIDTMVDKDIDADLMNDDEAIATMPPSQVHVPPTVESKVDPPVESKPAPDQLYMDSGIGIGVAKDPW